MLAAWGLVRFVPCSIGANHCRLRHIGWEKCGHGLTSWPRESASEPFLNELLGLFQYPPGSGRALLAGTLHLGYCAARFACRTPTWRLPESGHVAGLVTAVVEALGDAVAGCAVHEVSWVSGSGPGRKRIRLNRKNSAHLAGSMVRSRPRIWKRLRHLGHSKFSLPQPKRISGDQDDGRCNPIQIRIGVEQLPGALCRPASPGLQ